MRDKFKKGIGIYKKIKDASIKGSAVLHNYRYVNDGFVDMAHHINSTGGVRGVLLDHVHNHVAFECQLQTIIRSLTVSTRYTSPILCTF